jgi:hypothetical protein
MLPSFGIQPHIVHMRPDVSDERQLTHGLHGDILQEMATFLSTVLIVKEIISPIHI